MCHEMEKTIPTAEPKYTGYENIIVDCPLCGNELVFNRASDLRTFEPTAGTDVSCEKCKECFWLTNDTVNERHEILIFDCYDLLGRKRYINCILNLCQAYEMFFSLYLRVRLLYIPFGSNSDRDSSALCHLNRLSQNLEEEIKSFSFEKMRSCFLHLIIEFNLPSTLDEAENHIKNLDPKPPKDAELKSVADNLGNLLIRVKGTKINELRNKVVHKTGYRPTHVETEEALKEARSVLFPLTRRLNVHDDVNWYCKGSE